MGSRPNQVLLRVESEAFGLSRDDLKDIKVSTSETEIKALADAIERVFAAGDYVILKHARVIEENEELPRWLDDLSNLLAPSRRPKMFVISQTPVLGERRIGISDSAAVQRVPTISEYELNEFCYQLIGYFDKNPARWSDQDVQGLVKSAGGTIGFLVSLVRSSANVEDFDTIDQLIARDTRSMSTSITAYARWAFNQLRGDEDEQRVLIFLNDVSPCDLVDIESVVKPQKPILRVIGKLLELGVIEREGDSLYRLTPLLANRLSRDLIRVDLLTWLRKALYGFVREPIEFETSQHEYIRIESRIQASLLGETEHIPKGVLEFVSASHWFQAGVRLYHARRRGPAYRVLRKAYQARDEFRAESRVELTRYFCLSAIRNHKYDEADACIKLLDGVYNNKGIAAFLKADLLHHQGAFRDAIEQYEISLDLNKGKNSRIERTYRPLIQCIILSPRPDFRLAEIYAKKWLELRHTVFSLMALPRVYLNWKYRADPRNSAPSDIDARLEAARATLENDPGVGSAAFELRAEEAELTGDYTSAIEYMDRAIGVDPRFELRAERWRFLARSRIPDLVMKAISELDAARVNQDYQSNWLAFLPGLAETYGIALLILGSSFNALNTFAPQLSTAEIASIITKVRKRRL